MAATHQPVLFTEALAQLAVRADGVYVDATFGRGGHARGILAALGPDGRLLAIDRDPEAVAVAERELGADPRFTVTRGSFSMMERTVEEAGLLGEVDGILADLGVSSPQLDDASRGFSFVADGPLDMRMDPDSGVSAAEWLAGISEQEFLRVLWEYGEEKFARRIVRAVFARRDEGPITRTAELAEVVAGAVPTREPGKHPATRTFQAIRIAVNAELDELEAFLPQCAHVLRPGGVLCAISFHSLEDRIVKRFLRGPAEPPGPRGLPRPERGGPHLRPRGKAIKPGKAEIAANARARSAVLRVGERVQ
ncbi:MAG: 16S rRNA (cytosine(1402)-N(4))-methyltransferase RsmH [Xanthomonadaceae bacterium]|nr:16S rRNA (cytosine(1402)-N(4))-methyltransferase RsmH [Xanthomonadaceae bacterium]